MQHLQLPQSERELFDINSVSSARSVTQFSDAPVSVDSQTGQRLPRKNVIFRSWRPGDRPNAVATFLFAFGILFFILGIIILVLNSRVFLRTLRYDNLCTLGTSCQLDFFEVTKTIAGPSYLYYRIHGFHQNNKRYVSSIPYIQLRNAELHTANDLDGCIYYLTNADLKVTTAVDGTPLDAGEVAYPCGLAAATYFTDSFELLGLDGAADIPVSGDNITWKAMRDHQFKNFDLSRQWINVQNERFINWMTIAPFDDFMKTWGRIDQDIPPGRYAVRINNVWDSDRFEGQKEVMLAQSYFYGTRNYFLGITFVVVGVLSTLFGVLLVGRAYHRHRRSRRHHLGK